MCGATAGSRARPLPPVPYCHTSPTQGQERSRRPLDGINRMHAPIRLCPEHGEIFSLDSWWRTLTVRPSILIISCWRPILEAGALVEG